ncbi:hypothetical protein PFICI_13462 [Pestalotiopsis fici W106-1]|uniref:DUF2306 domain-containing protein n=1 Tax=Pestalotiopsis fici (strain W106-1 / CGMCC3.15140) TaxID=1229662 RepID=W3WM77_PESFW|nr:uncharacterized protein PFICI_13462 [Pestalotiopsis fici W106-1]ETS74978.1 hypothetical protein PFICI_13462 [Pestalotiopsis fici W106-1]
MLSTISTRLGFSSNGRAICWLVFGGTLFLFAITRLKYLDFYGTFCNREKKNALPGECFYFLRTSLEEIGMLVHLYCVIPASILVWAQFVPSIRRRGLGVHRVNGRVCLALGIVGAVAVIPNIRRAFGGDPAAQLANITLVGLFVMSSIKGYQSIKQHRVQDHRAWMLRSWCYAGGIITVRIVMVLSAILISMAGGYYIAQPCDKIDHVLYGRNNTLSRYPGCAPFYTGEKLDQHVVVDANLMNAKTDLMQLVSAFNLGYPMSAWISLALHVLGPEVYLRMSQEDREPGKPANNGKVKIGTKED